VSVVERERERKRERERERERVTFWISQDEDDISMP
jgi:hypothetical protein